MAVLGDILLAHAAFKWWCREKEHVPTVVGRAFPPRHPLAAATLHACFGDPLGIFRLTVDNAACEACNSMGEQEFCHAAGRTPTDLFYGSSLRALAPEVPVSLGLRHGQWLNLWDLTAIAETACAAEAFMVAARALTTLPRTRTKTDRCESHWRENLRKCW